jgi:hypothetical protein
LRLVQGIDRTSWRHVAHGTASVAALTSDVAEAEETIREHLGDEDGDVLLHEFSTARRRAAAPHQVLDEGLQDLPGYGSGRVPCELITGR